MAGVRLISRPESSPEPSSSAGSPRAGCILDGEVCGNARFAASRADAVTGDRSGEAGANSPSRERGRCRWTRGGGGVWKGVEVPPWYGGRLHRVDSENPARIRWVQGLSVIFGQNRLARSPPLGGIRQTRFWQKPPSDRRLLQFRPAVQPAARPAHSFSRSLTRSVQSWKTPVRASAQTAWKEPSKRPTSP